MTTEYDTLLAEPASEKSEYDSLLDGGNEYDSLLSPASNPAQTPPNASAPQLRENGSGGVDAGNQVASGNAVGDFFRRVGAGIASSTSDAVSGGLKISSDIGLPATKVAETIKAFGGPDIVGGTQQFAQDVGERAASDYGVNPDRDNELASTIASGIGSIIPTLASGPLAPITGASMMGESARQEAQDTGGTTTQENVAFYSNAAVGAITEKLMGLPALMKSVKAAKIPAATVEAMIGRAIIQAAKSAGREGTQEGVEQMAGNFIASEIAAYDPERPLMKGVKESVIAGAAIGAPLGAAIQVAENIDTQKAAASKSTADAGAPVTAVVTAMKEPPALPPPLPELVSVGATQTSEAMTSGKRVIPEIPNDLATVAPTEGDVFANVEKQPSAPPLKATPDEQAARPASEPIAETSQPTEAPVPVAEATVTIRDFNEKGKLTSKVELPPAEAEAKLTARESALAKVEKALTKPGATLEKTLAKTDLPPEVADRIKRDVEIAAAKLESKGVDAKTAKQQAAATVLKKVLATTREDLASVRKPAEPAPTRVSPLEQLRQLEEEANPVYSEPPPLSEGLYKSKNEEARAYKIAQGFKWNGEDWVHPDYPGKTPYSDDIPKPKASDVRMELAKLRGQEGDGVSRDTQRTKGRTSDVSHAVGDYVEFREGVVAYKNGEPFGTTKKVRGSVTLIKPDGSIEIRRTDGGFSVKRPEEVVASPSKPSEPPPIPNPAGEKLANDIRKVGKTSRDQTADIERELGYYSEQELADLQQHLGTPDAEPATIARAITGKDKLGDERSESSYGKDEVAKGGRTDAIDELAQQEGYVGGPGAMGPREAAAMEAGKSTTSTKNAVMEAERAARNADPIVREARKSNEQTFSEAETVIENNPNAGQEIVSGLRDGTKTQVSEVDEAVLLYEKIKLRNERDMEADRASDIYASEESRAAAAERWAGLEQKINELDEATRKSGSIWGRLGQFRQRLMRDDFTFEAMERKARVSKGAPLTPEESAKIKEQATKIAELEKQLADTQQKSETKGREEAADTATKELLKAAEAAKKEDPQVQSLADRIISKLTSAADKARARIRERLSRASAGLDPTVLYDVSIIGAEKIAKGAVKFGRWSSEMIADLGDAIKPYLDDGWKAANDMLDKQVESVAPKDKREKVKSRVKKEDTTGTREKLVEGIKTRVGEGDAVKDLQPLVQKLALNFVREGINERNALVDAVHGELSKLVPGIERNTTMDLISGYGDFKPLDTDAAKTTLRGLKGELQQIGKIEDMTKKVAPRKTGVERRTPTDEERKLIKQVNELKKKGGFVVTDQAKQLKTAMDAIKTRLNNEIRDLDMAIATKEPIPNKKGSVAYDAEAAALKTKRDALKARYDELFPKAPMTDAQRISMASRALDRSIEELSADIKSGKLYPDAPRKLTSPELEAKRARLDQLRAERDLLRDLDTATIEANTVKSLEDAVKKLEERIAKGDTEVKTGKPTVDSEAVAKLKEQRDTLNKQISDMRRGPKKTDDEIALAAYKSRALRSIADMQDRMARGDFTKKPARTVKMDKEANELSFKLNKVKTEYLKDRFNDVLKNRSTPRKVFENARDSLNTARAVMTSFDLSAVLRQGGFIALGNPVRAAKSIVPMLRAMVSEKAQFEINQEIASRPNAELYRQAKLYISDPTEVNPSKMEEAYMSRWAEKIPGVAGSQRAYTTFLNKLRADSFDAMVKTLGKGGAVTPEEAKAIANYVNVATGRGNLAGSAAGAGVSLNALFFSPRYLLSRFELLAGQPMYGGTARTRALVAKEYAKFLIGAGVVYSLAMAAGGEMDDDPRSSDFLKIKFGNTRIDPLNGLLQVSVLASRLATGEKKTLSGKVMSIREGANGKVPYGGQDAYGVISQFLRTKFSPPVGAAIDMMAGKNVIGEKTTVGGTALRMMVPLSGGDILRAMEEQGMARGTAMGILALFGMGVQTFDPNKPKTE